MGVLDSLRIAGLRVPADVSVIGFDDMQLGDHMNPPLTTVRQDQAGLGAAARAALVRLIQGAAHVHPSTVLPVELLRRGSTRPRAPRAPPLKPLMSRSQRPGHGAARG